MHEVSIELISNYFKILFYLLCMRMWMFLVTGNEFISVCELLAYHTLLKVTAPPLAKNIFFYFY